jgi:hypothetical protein
VPSTTPATGVEAPPLPEGYDPRTVSWWEAVKALPHAPAFLRADWEVALRGAWVAEMVWAKPTGALLTELRRIESSLGMTRGDRERLGVAAAATPSPSPRPGRRPDPRFDTVEEYEAWREHQRNYTP